MSYRRALKLLPRGRECFISLCQPRLQKLPNSTIQATLFNEHGNNACGRTTRALHSGTPLMVTKLLSTEEIFAKSALQEYLRKVESDYNECLSEVNSNMMEDPGRVEELRAKRTKLSMMTPLIQSIRELKDKQRQLVETETLLKGTTAHDQNVITGSRSIHYLSQFLPNGVVRLY